MSYLAGIDGGGTKTVCVVADAEGRIRGTGRGGPSNYQKDGLFSARNSLRHAVRDALSAAELRPQDVTGVCAGLAGVDRAEDSRVMAQVLRQILPADHLVVENDALVALIGATGRRPGVIVIAGTGSIALGVNRKGERARAGGWGHILDDEGSGYDIARRGVMAALQDFDGRGAPTRLRDMVAKELFLNTIADVIPLLHRGQLNHTQIAALLPVVLEAAEEGDEVARQLISDAGLQLAGAARAVVESLGEQDADFPVATAGGVFLHSERLRECFTGHLREMLPKARVIRPAQPPEQGALLVARAAVEGEPLFGHG